MDFITDLPLTPNGHTAIWVVVDRLSKLAHLVPTVKTANAERVARLYVNEVYRHHGVPTDIVSDRDVRFNAAFWRHLHKILGAELYMSTKKHAESDGQTENANGILEDTLRHFIGPYHSAWEDGLAVVEFAMNNAWNESIQNTPFMLNYGQHPNDPVSARLRSQNQQVNRFVGNWHEQLKRAKQCIAAAQQRHKHAADKKRRPAPEYKFGDQVLLKTSFFNVAKGFCRKFAPRWVGPFTVKKVSKNKLAVTLSLPDKAKRMHPVFHVSALRPYLSSGAYQPPPPLPDYIDGEPEWEVNYIESTKGEGKRRQYLVHWMGHTDHATWEPLSNMTNCSEEIQAFWDNKRLPCPHPLAKPPADS